MRMIKEASDRIVTPEEAARMRREVLDSIPVVLLVLIDYIVNTDRRDASMAALLLVLIVFLGVSWRRWKKGLAAWEAREHAEVCAESGAKTVTRQDVADARAEFLNNGIPCILLAAVIALWAVTPERRVRTPDPAVYCAAAVHAASGLCPVASLEKRHSSPGGTGKCRKCGTAVG